MKNVLINALDGFHLLTINNTEYILQIIALQGVTKIMININIRCIQLRCQDPDLLCSAVFLCASMICAFKNTWDRFCEKGSNACFFPQNFRYSRSLKYTIFLRTENRSICHGVAML